ncbi:TonB-dependent receptor [Formosa sp. PL04]|uniref:TonB-dependent receptor n=1 Tax=Formosa sp. PL04 TaxID=3081755 RepID=UPI00298236FB|nr:TonB-dependent receptor [Formosa sp. PL04]MDW5289320.1 TonB-dependent receptor [Formosa sp. PL04]
MKHFLIALVFLTTVISYAQNTGSIVGTLTDKEYNNEPLAFANILIKGTTTGTTSDMDGVYAFTEVTPGSYILVYSFVGYLTQEVSIEVSAGNATKVDVIMTASAAALDEVLIQTTTKKESETALLLDQKNAVAFKQSIGAQEISRKGVGDVATAVSKVSGISKQEGSGSIYVRGLGDRYNMTTLNGLPLPSNNPSNKNIDLALFNTDMVEYIGIDKTYDAQNYGDFGGANINVESKDYKGNGYIELALAAGVNTEAISLDTFYLNDGPNFSGFYDINYPAYPLSNYNFTTSWDREAGPTPLNSSISLKGGDSYRLGEDTKLNFFAVASFDNGYTYREGVSRGGVNTGAVPDSDLNFNNYDYLTSTTLMGNIGIKHKNQAIKYDVLYLNASSQKQQEYYGIIDKDDDAQEGGGFIQRAVFERTELLVNQLHGDHEIADNLDVNWGASYNMLDNIVPNRRQVTLLPVDSTDPDGPKSFQLISSSSDNNRYYHELKENEFAANLSTTYKFGKDEDDDYRGQVTLGYNGRFKTVDFQATQFNFRITTRNSSGNIIQQPVVQDIYDVDAYFNQQNFEDGLFSIETFRGGITATNALTPQTYGGDQNINAGFVNFEYTFSPKFVMLAGLRGEQISQTIAWSTSLDVSGDENVFETFEILPSLSLKYILNEKNNLRFAASKTYTLPQYKERAYFLFQEVNQDYQGNPALYASTVYNADLKWDFFPESSEIISLGAFGKYIENPINTATINSASNDISYVNSGDSGTAFGAELEVRKNILESEVEYNNDYLETNLSFGFNASYMYTNQELDGDKVLRETTAAGIPLSVTFTEDEGQLSGASDLLLNADVSFYKDLPNDKSISTTLAYNYFSDRIYALGVLGKGNLVDGAVGTLDFIAKYQLNQNLTLGASAKNILNPTVIRYQAIQDVTVLSYKKGSNFNLSLSYTF